VDYTRAQLISLMAQAALGLNHMHSFTPRPILHRDIKSLNILLTHDYRHAKLADFGFARVQATNMTNQRGNVLWMAPEVQYWAQSHTPYIDTQVFTGTKYSTECDVFSLAICLWEVLTGRMPYHDANGHPPDITAFKGNVILWYAEGNTHDPPLRPSPMPKIAKAPDLIDLMKEAWAKDPTVRPTAAKVHQRLVDVLKKFPGSSATCLKCEDTPNTPL
jgi:serine/threonine protein kinase